MSQCPPNTLANQRPTPSISCDTLNRMSVLTLKPVRPHPGEKRKLVSLGKVQIITGARYCDVPLTVKSPHSPRPPYNSAPAANLSLQKVQRLPVIGAKGRLAPTAYPNSQRPP